MNRLSSQILLDIIGKAMNLAPDQLILRNQNFMYPNDTRLYVVAGIVDSQFISNQTYTREGLPSNTWDQLNRFWDTTGTYDSGPVQNFDDPGQNYDIAGQTWDATEAQYTEVNRLQVRENIQIDIASRSNEATFRHWEVVAAMQGIYSQQTQELNQFKIFRIPRNFIDTSGAEGPAYLNRYTITISCFVWYVKETLIQSFDYYDDFHQRVDNANTIGTDQPLIEFEINQGGIVP